MWRRPKYMLRQLVLLVTAVATPLVALQWYALRQNESSAREAVYRSVGNDAASIAQDADQLIADTERYLEFLSHRPLVLAIDRTRCDPLIEGITRRRRHVANVFITDNAGSPVCFSVTGPGKIPVDLNDLAPGIRIP